MVTKKEYLLLGDIRRACNGEMYVFNGTKWVSTVQKDTCKEFIQRYLNREYEIVEFLKEKYPVDLI